MKNYEAQEQLNLIKKMMEDSRRISVDNGFYYIFWGSLISVALIINYTLVKINSQPQNIGFMWMLLMVIGAIIGGIFEYKFNNRSKVKTFAGEITASLWISLGVIIFSIVFVGIITKVYPIIYVSGFIAMLLSIGYFTSGVIQRISWLKYIAVIWWLGGWGMFYLKGPEIMLTFAVMLIFFQTIPGIILYKKYKKELQFELNSQS